MSKCDDNRSAKIIMIKDASETDERNPVEKLRSKPIIGLVIMADGRKSDTDTWSSSLYDSQDGTTCAGTSIVKSADTLDLEGCTHAVLCKALTWTRVKDERAAATAK